ncbi:hypothetical protein FOCC_FOCC009377, partial [Frankliniella occidentalis]
MPRQPKRMPDPNRPKKGQFKREDMEQAVHEVRRGTPLRAAATKFQVPKSTLQRYVKSTEGQEDLQSAKLTPNYDSKRIFSREQEKEFSDYLILCAKMGFGLDSVQVRQLAYQMATRNKIEYPKNWDKEEIAGKEWLFGFRKRNPTLSMRKPEACSKSRASSFTPENMAVFFGNLKKVIDKHPSVVVRLRIWNLDEVGTTTVGAVKRKILGPAGERQISQCKTAERGTLVTTCCFISAAGTTMPPVMIFPRVNFQSHMLLDAYPGTLGLAAKSGWMNEETFAKTLTHFVQHSGASLDDPVLLVMDNDPAHISIEALDIAKSNGVIIVTLSPHTSHKTQPLDVAVFSPFRGYYDNAVRLWITNNPGKQVTIYHIASFVKIGIEKAMTPGTILSGFRKTGIYPFNPDVFTEADFLSSLPYRTNETPETPSTTPTSQTPGSSTANDNEGAGGSETSTPTTTAGSAVVTEATVSGGEIPTAASGGGFLGPLQIRGLPKVQAQASSSTSTRPKGRSLIPTDTPEKDAITSRKIATREKKQRAERNKAAKALAAATGAAKKKTTKKKVASPTSSDSEADEDEPLPLMDSDASETWAEEETPALPVVEPESAAELPRALEEEDYVLVSVSSSKKKGAPKNYKIGKVLSTTTRSVQVTFLKNSKNVRHKFSICDPPEIQSVSVNSVVTLLPKPSVSGTKRQGNHLAFEVDFS